MNKIAIIASAVALALGVSACSEQKTLEQLLASANEYSQNRDFNSATVELKNAVRLSPKSAEARIALGRVYIEQGNYIFAEKELEKSLELGINFSEIAALIAVTKSKLSKYDDLQELVVKSSALDDNDYIKVLTYAGIAALNNNAREEAQDYISQAVAISEKSIFSQLGKAYLAQLDEDYAQGLADIVVALETDPNFSEAILLQGHLQFNLEDYELAADSFAKYIKLHPFEYNINYFQINSLIKAGLFKEAEVLTDNLLKKFKSAPLALHYKAQLQYQNKNYEEAKNSAEKAIQEGLTMPLTKLIAGTSAYQLKDYEQAYNHLKLIEPYLTNTHPIQKVLAVVKLQLGYNLEAADNLLSLEGLTSKDSEFLQSSAANLVVLGDLDSAQGLIDKAKQVDPNNASILTQSGLVSISQDNIDVAIKSLEQAIKLDPSLIEVELALGIQYLKTGDDSKAKDIANKLIKDHSNNSSGYILQGVIFAKEGNKDEAIESFNKSLKITPNNIASLYNLGLLIKDEENVKPSMSYFEQVIKLAPSHKSALSNYIALAGKSSQLDHSRDFLKGIENNGNLVLTVALAQNLRLNSQMKEAVALLENFTNKKVIDSGYWLLLGDLHMQLKNTNKAGTAYNEGLKLNPKHYLLNLRSIGMLEVLKKYPEALAQAKLAYEYYPNIERLEVLLAHLELRNKNFKAAKEMLNVIEQKQIEHPLVDDVAGVIALQSKNYEQAVESFSAALEKKQSDDNAIQLARALKFNGQQREAEIVLENFVENQPNNVKVRFLLAELYKAEDRSKRIQQYQAINDISPNNVAALNNLAWNEYKNGQVNEALSTAKQAYALAADNLAILETYGVILVASQKYKEAIEILELATVKGSKGEEVITSLAKAKAAFN